MSCLASDSSIFGLITEGVFSYARNLYASKTAGMQVAYEKDCP